MNKRRQSKEFIEGDRVNFCSFPRAGSHWLLDMLGNCTVGIFDEQKNGWRSKINKTHGLHVFRNPVVYLYRHGKDVALSFAKMRHYRMVVTREMYNGSFDAEFVRWIMIETRMPSRWQFHMDYYFLMSNTKICYMRYEDALLEPVRALKIIMAFYGMDVEALDTSLVLDYLGVQPAQRGLLKKFSDVEGYVPRLSQVSKGSLSPYQRLSVFTERWKDAPEWTEEVDMIVDYYMKDTLIKYGYLP